MAAPRPGSTLPLLAALAAPGSPAIAADRMAVVVAHPDDETIGCGALLGRLNGVTLVMVTDGAPRNLADARVAGFSNAAGYARARSEELAAALALGGRAEVRTVSLGVPDQEAAHHLPEIARGLALLLGRMKIETVLTHAYEGGHPDHEATAFAVHAARQLLARTDRSLAVLEMPFYRLGPYGMLTQDFAEGGGRPLILQLSEEERHRKAAMIAAYVSQRRTLAGFGIELELFRPAPEYDFASLPNEGRLLYEAYDWGLTGAQWLEASRAALAELGLRRRPWA
jgi:LmbE family N-acetylglucosaminyl deacetylase